MRLIIIFLLISSVGYSQWEDCTNFDSSFSNVRINLNGIWEIGIPSKSTFNTTKFGSKSIITDTLNFYPINDTSSFILTYYPSNFVLESNFLLIEMYHRYETDSLLDSCSIEYSIDGGNQWYNMSTDTLTPHEQYHHFLDPDTTVYDEILFTGTSNGWINSVFSRDIWGYMTLDSVLIKFLFISDSISDNKDGWQIDSICISEFHAGSVSEYDQLSAFATIYPNPTRDHLTIDFSNKYNEAFNFRLINSTGQVLKQQKDIRDEQIIIENLNLSPGLYYYELSVRGILKGVGKIVVE